MTWGRRPKTHDDDDDDGGGGGGGCCFQNRAILMLTECT